MGTTATIPKPRPNPHEDWARMYSTEVLLAIRETLGKQNLSNLRDNETRWKADRVKAVRAEIRRRNGGKP